MDNISLQPDPPTQPEKSKKKKSDYGHFIWLFISVIMIMEAA